MTSTRFHVFGYGSLMYQPERPELVLERIPARLRGHHRAFNKRSSVRGCLAHEVRWTAPLSVPSAFHTQEQRHSLALGTEESPGSVLHGMVLSYPAAHTQALTRALDLREGFVDGSPPEHNSYRRCRVTVHTERGPLEALTYLGEPRSELYHPVSPTTAARVLLAATPAPGGKARGVDYLIEARDILARVGLTDPHLDAIAAALLATPGPWQDYLRERLTSPTNS